MKNSTLLELVKRWEKEAVKPDDINGAEEAKISNAKMEGYRECKRECASVLRMLMDIFND